MSNRIEQLGVNLPVKGPSTSQTPVGKIIVVDDEPELKNILVESLSAQGFEVTGCTNGPQALAELREKEFDLLLTDLMMPDMDGIALLEAAAQLDPNLISIMMTGQGTIQTAVDAMKLGAFDYVLKPFKLQNVMPVLTRAINTRRLRMENLQLRETVAIYSLCQTIAFTLDAQTILSRLADAALQQSDADEVSVLLPTSEGSELYVAAVRGDQRERLLGERIPLQESISSWVARERTPLILNGEVHDDRFLALWPRPEIRSAVSVPMQVANKLVGVINLNVTTQLRPFTLGQMKALTILASTAAAALESASLYKQVQEAEKNYRSIFENAVEGIFQSTLDGRFITVNPSMARILGYDSPAEMISTITDITRQFYVHPQSHQQAALQERRGVVQRFEFEAYRKDGEKIWLSLNRRCLRDEHGTEIFHEGSVEDITERKRAEAERLVLFEITQGVITTHNLKELFKLIHKSIGKILRAKNCFIGLYDDSTSLMNLEYWVDEFEPVPLPHPPGKGFSSYVLHTNQPLLLTDQLKNKLYDSGEVERSGRSSASWLGVPLRTPERAIGVLVLQDYEDNTAYGQRDLEFLASVGDQIALAIERKRAAEAFKNSEAEMRALFAAMTDVIFVLDDEGRYVRIAPTDPTYLYDESAQLMGKTLHEVFPKSEADLFLEHIRRALAEGKTHRVEYRLRIGGNEVWFDGSVSPMSENSVVWIARDITERKRAEEEKAQLTAEIENQRQRLNNIVASVPGVVWEAWGEPDAANQQIFVSDYVEQMLGYSTEEWTSTPNFWLSIVHPDDREGAGEAAAQAFASGKSHRMEFRWLTKNGREVWVESNFVVVLNEQGQPLGMRGVNTDVGERKRAEEALRRSESQLAEAQRVAHIGSWNWNLQQNELTWSDEHCRIFGVEPGAHVDYDEIVNSFMPPADQELVRSVVTRSIETKEPFNFEYHIVRRDGEERIIQSSGSIETDDQGQAIRMFGTAQDVTERIRIEQELRQSEERYRELVENAHDLIYEHDLQGNYVSANTAVEQMTGYSLEESVHLNLAELVVPENLGYAQEMIRRKLEGQKVTAYELEIIAKDGRYVPVEINSSLVLRNGTAVGVRGIARDITERRRAEKALRDSEERYRRLFDSNPQPMWVYDLETLAFLAVNQSAVKSYGYSREEFLTMTIKDIRPPKDIPALYESLNSGSEEVETAKCWRHLKKDGTLIDVEITSHLFVFDGRQAELILANDITERNRLESALLTTEEQLRQSQKLEAIGQLAGGVAHDFNNLLTVIGGYSSILLGKLDPASPLRMNAEEIKKASDRAAGLTRQLLAFSRKQILQPKILDLNLVVSDLEKMVRRLIGEDIDLLAITDAKLGQVKADPGQIEQVLLNLIVNARDAMPSGGKLTIETANTSLSPEHAASHGAAGGPYVMLAVSDTGCGMSAELQEHVFEPFFTTKLPGKGTGLGLATVYGIVKQSDGHIWLYSEPGKGTCFKIFLPRVDEIVVDQANVTSVSEVPKGTETLLLVEDEDQVRQIVKAILEQQGYDVLAAANGEEALKLAELHGPGFQLLLTDLVMPQMSGRELAEQLTTRLPHLKVLYMSGYTDDAIVRHGLLDASLSFIQKPFDAATAARKVREVLDSGVP